MAKTLWKPIALRMAKTPWDPIALRMAKTLWSVMSCLLHAVKIALK